MRSMSEPRTANQACGPAPAPEGGPASERPRPGARPGTRNAFKHGRYGAAARAARAEKRARCLSRLCAKNSTNKSNNSVAEARAAGAGAAENFLPNKPNNYVSAAARAAEAGAAENFLPNKSNNYVSMEAETPRRRGAPKGNKNALKHGLRSAEFRAFDDELRSLLRLARLHIAHDKACALYEKMQRRRARAGEQPTPDPPSPAPSTSNKPERLGGLDMSPNPIGQFGLGERARRDGEHDQRRFRLIRDQPLAVEAKKQRGGDEGDALVAVDEGMILGKAESIARGQARRIGDAFVSKQILRPRQSGLEQPRIAQTIGAAMLGDAFAVQQLEGLAVEPNGLAHLASARKVSRYSRMTSRPASTCRATSGSYGVSRYPSGAGVAVTVSPFSSLRSASISLGNVAPRELPIWMILREKCMATSVLTPVITSSYNKRMNEANLSGKAILGLGEAALGLHPVGRSGEPERRLVAVDGLELAGLDQVGLMPDADRAVGIADAPVELGPGGKVLAAAVVGIDRTST